MKEDAKPLGENIQSKIINEVKTLALAYLQEHTK